jgi:hypothetical protein
VLERYPTNGKLLKVYGRFLEFVRNDPWGERLLLLWLCMQCVFAYVFLYAGVRNICSCATAVVGNDPWLQGGAACCCGCTFFMWMMSCVRRP